MRRLNYHFLKIRSVVSPDLISGVLDVDFCGIDSEKRAYLAADCLGHSVTSGRIGLAEEIEKQCAKIGKVMDVLVEINSGREENKGGILPEDAAQFCLALRDFPHLRLRGFMTMAPKCEKIEEYRKFFAETYQNALDIWQKKLDNIGGTPILSMGMSDSFEAAVMEGATIVRVGGALFRA